MEKRLGRGLGSLLGQSTPNEQKKGVSELPIHEIAANPFQPRKHFEPAAHEELVESIRRHGLLQPILVRRTESGYQLISGERRLRASKQAGLSKIHATVREDVSDASMLELALVENVQRQDLDAMERAEGYHQMMESLGITQEQVAEKVGLKRATVANHLRLLELPPTAQEALRKGIISMGHARAVLGAPTVDSMLSLVGRILREDLSVRDVEKLVRDMARSKGAIGAQVPTAAAPAAWVRELEDKMRSHLGTKVTLRNEPGYKGQITIEYYSREDLERLCDVLAPRKRL